MGGRGGGGRSAGGVWGGVGMWGWGDGGAGRDGDSGDVKMRGWGREEGGTRRGGGSGPGVGVGDTRPPPHPVPTPRGRARHFLPSAASAQCGTDGSGFGDAGTQRGGARGGGRSGAVPPEPPRCGQSAVSAVPAAQKLRPPQSAPPRGPQSRTGTPRGPRMRGDSEHADVPGVPRRRHRPRSGWWEFGGGGVPPRRPRERRHRGGVAGARVGAAGARSGDRRGATGSRRGAPPGRKEGERGWGGSHQHHGEALLQLARLRHRHLPGAQPPAHPRGSPRSRAPGQRFPVRALHVPHPRAQQRGAVGRLSPLRPPRPAPPVGAAPSVPSPSATRGRSTATPPRSARRRLVRPKVDGGQSAPRLRKGSDQR